jgi:hypothetical protein
VDQGSPVRRARTACDEEVLTRGGNPQVYAESILKICKLYLNPPLTCVSGIAGANLKNRIEAIMRCRIGVRLDLGRAILLTLASVMALVVPITAGAVQAREGQTETERTIAEFLQLSALHASEAPVGVAQRQIALEGGGTAGQQSVDARPMLVARTVQPATVIHGTWESRILHWRDQAERQHRADSSLRWTAGLANLSLLILRRSAD